MNTGKRTGSHLWPKLWRGLVDPRYGATGSFRLVVWLIAISAMWPGIFVEPQSLAQYHDEHYFFSHEEAARRTITEFHQLPTWDPWHLGGMVTVANPQSTILAPDFVLRVFFGTAPGRRLAILLFVLLGLEGMFWLLRQRRVNVLPALAASYAFGFCGAFPAFIAGGWLNFLGFLLLPWVLFFANKAVTDWRYAFASAGFIAWMLLCGGTYTVPYTVLILSGWTVYQLVATWISGRLTGRPTRTAVVLRAYLLIGIVSVGLSAVRLVPLSALIRQYPRPWLGHLSVSLEQVWSMLVTPGGNPGATAYVGLGVVLASGLVVLNERFRGIGALLAAGAFVALAVGDQGSFSPYVLLRKLPLYSQLRAPERFGTIIAFFLCIAAGHGLTGLQDRLRQLLEGLANGRRIPAGTGSVVSFIVVLVLVLVYAQDHRQHAAIPAGGIHRTAPPLVVNQEFRQARGNRWDAQVWVPTNLGCLQWFEETAFPQSPLLRGDRDAEEFPEDPEQIQVRRVFWSPTKIVLDVQAAAAGKVYVNQNYHEGWTASVGHTRNTDGLLSIDVPKGNFSMTLTFRDRLVMLGAMITLASILCCVMLLIVGRSPRAP